MTSGPAAVAHDAADPGAPGPRRDPAEERDWTWRDPLALFAAVLAAMVLVVWWAAHDGVVDLYSTTPPSYTGSWLLGGWFRFDAGWYDVIAVRGYSYGGPDQQSPVAFFPAYPLLLRGLHGLTGLPVELLGTLVTIVCGAGAAVLFHRWCVDRIGPRAARTAVVLLLVYPYAWYLYGAVYADALFLVAVLAAFVLLERGHPIWAGLAGAVATATRPVGVALIIGLVAVVLMRREVLRRGHGRLPLRLDLRRLRPADAGVLLSAGGLLAWMTYLGRTFDEPFAFQLVQRAPGWDQGSGPHTWFKVTFLQRLGRLPEYVQGWLDGSGGINSFKDTLYTVGITLQALLMLGFIVLLWVVWRRIGWGYAVYAAAVIAVPLLGSKDFQGVGRYLLAAFPCIAAAGLLLVDRPIPRWIWLPISSILLAAWAFAYARGYYVA
jgi:hypothetical protein